MVSILAYLREAGVVHRDLKPANFLLDENWNLKVADFVSAQTHANVNLKLHKINSASEFEQNSAERSQDLFKYSDDNLVGTEAYISPEAIQANSFEKVSYESDLWSLGVIIWQLFSSKNSTPFTGENQTEVFAAIKNGKYEKADLATPEIADLIEKLLVRRPLDRLGSNSINELIEHPAFNTINFN